jgi:hypothetical protein
MAKRTNKKYTVYLKARKGYEPEQVVVDAQFAAVTNNGDLTFHNNANGYGATNNVGAFARGSWVRFGIYDGLPPPVSDEPQERKIVL